MPEPGLARRYATALFQAAARRELLDRVEADLAATVELLQRQPELREFLLSPQVLDEHKQEIVTRALGPHLAPLVHHFLQHLLRKRRFDHLELIHHSLIEQLDTHRGIVKATVTTAIDLRPEIQERLRAQLEVTTKRKVRLESRVDPAILGGTIVVLDDQLIDLSVRSEIWRIRDDLMSVRVI